MRSIHRYLSAVTVLATTVAVTVSSDAGTAEPGPPVLSAEISLAEWRIDDPASIRVGRLGLIHEASGERLQVYDLRSQTPRQPEVAIDSSLPAAATSCLLLTDFQRGNVNRLGGQFGIFERAPSSARFDIDRRPHGRRSLMFSYRRLTSGFAGLWTQLYDSSDRRVRTYLDAGRFEVLTLWVRGREGGERLLLKLADARLDSLGESLSVGELGSYVPQRRLTTLWQLATVSLSEAPPTLDRGHLAGLALEAAAGVGAVEVGPIAVCRNHGEPPPLPAFAPAPIKERELETAIWVWNTRELLHSPEARAECLTFLERAGFAHVYLQLPGDTGIPARLADDSSTPEPTAPGESSLRSLVAAFRGLGLTVRALDGHASFVKPEKQEQVLQTIRDVAAYNAAAAPGERFHGVHYDIEPYLLPGFGGGRRQEIAKLYVELVARMAVEARRADLQVGLDLPFWYDTSDDFGGEPLAVELAGRHRPIIEHIVDSVDYVTLMDYRTHAYGADGVLFHANGEIDYAGRVGKKVYIGLETGRLPDEAYLDFTGEPGQGLPAELTDGEHVVVHVRGPTAVVYLLRKSQLGRLRELLGEVETEGTVLYWPLTSRIEVPESKLTFANFGAEALAAVMRQVHHELAPAPAFAGFALHHYGSLKELAAGSP